jgi:UDP-N-acetylmuramate dehydrogenase
LISDEGIRGFVIINRARNIRIEARNTPPTVWAESGANLGAVARQVALRGYSGLEWAATVPGTVGGAVYGNAGAHGADMKSNVLLVEILHRTRGKETWTVDQLEYEYRSSALKRDPGTAVVLAARLQLQPSTTDVVQQRMDEFSTRRRATQPPGASMGSMFKNPLGDAAGRLIDAAGLKGSRRGGAEISPTHANFIVNTGNAKAADVFELIQLARQAVYDRFGVKLELEIELLGSFPNLNN